jgi:aspartate/methionine/tyrosine aminotransferase
MGFDQAAESIVGPTNRSRGVLAEFLARHDMRHVIGKGYYAFVDVGPWLDQAGLADSAALGAILGERFGIAVVPGVYFSDAGARWIRFSYALKPETTAAAAERLWEGLSSL